MAHGTDGVVWLHSIAICNKVPMLNNIQDEESKKGRELVNNAAKILASPVAEVVHTLCGLGPYFGCQSTFSDDGVLGQIVVCHTQSHSWH